MTDQSEEIDEEVVVDSDSDSHHMADSVVIDSSDSDSEDEKASTLNLDRERASVHGSSRGSVSSEDDSSTDDEGDDDLGDLIDLTKEELLREAAGSRRQAREAKATIAALIDQITDYQKDMEDDKAQLERSIAELQAAFETEIEASDARAEAQEAEKLRNLATLLQEVENIEEVNSSLQAELRAEREAHASALAELEVLKVELEAAKKGKGVSEPANEGTGADGGEGADGSAKSAGPQFTPLAANDRVLVPQSTTYAEFAEWPEAERSRAFTTLLADHAASSIMASYASVMLAVAKAASVENRSAMLAQAKYQALSALEGKQASQIGLTMSGSSAVAPTSLTSSAATIPSTATGVAGTSTGVDGTQTAGKPLAQLKRRASISDTLVRSSDSMSAVREDGEGGGMSSDGLDVSSPTRARIDNMRTLILNETKAIEVAGQERQTNKMQRFPTMRFDRSSLMQDIRSTQSTRRPAGVGVPPVPVSAAATDMVAGAASPGAAGAPPTSPRGQLGSSVMRPSGVRHYDRLPEEQAEAWKTMKPDDFRRSGFPTMVGQQASQYQAVPSIPRAGYAQAPVRSDDAISQLAQKAEALEQRALAASDSAALASEVAAANVFSFYFQVDELAVSVSTMVTVSPTEVWVGSADGHILGWDAKAVTGRSMSHRPRFSVAAHSQSVTALIVVHGKVWSASKDRSVAVWGLKGCKLAARMERHSGHVTTLVHLPAQREVWSASADLKIMCWDAKSFSHIRQIPTDHYMLCARMFAGKVWIGTESAIVLWDPDTRKRVTSLKHHSKFVHDLAVTADGTAMWSVSSDATIGLWSAEGKLLRSLLQPGKVLKVLSVGPHMWIGGRDGTLTVFESSTGKELQRIPGVHDNAVTGIVAATMGKGEVAVWSGAWDRRINLFKCKYEGSVVRTEHEREEDVPTGAAFHVQAGKKLAALGHEFAKVKFTRTAHCRHCHEELWSLLSGRVGYCCLVCNTTAHKKCLRSPDFRLRCPGPGGVVVPQVSLRAPLNESSSGRGSNTPRSRGSKMIARASSAMGLSSNSGEAGDSAAGSPAGGPDGVSRKVSLKRASAVLRDLNIEASPGRAAASPTSSERASPKGPSEAGAPLSLRRPSSPVAPASGTLSPPEADLASSSASVSSVGSGVQSVTSLSSGSSVGGSSSRSRPKKPKHPTKCQECAVGKVVARVKRKNLLIFLCKECTSTPEKTKAIVEKFARAAAASAAAQDSGQAADDGSESQGAAATAATAATTGAAGAAGAAGA